jgi:hypothetical protein
MARADYSVRLRRKSQGRRKQLSSVGSAETKEKSQRFCPHPGKATDDRPLDPEVLRYLKSRVTNSSANRIFYPQPRAAIALSPELLFLELQRGLSVKLNSRTLKLALAGAFLLSICSGAFAQSTVFNIPSSDVESPRKVFLEADFITHFASYKDGGYQTYGPRVVVGLPGHTEAGVNVFYTKSSDTQPVIIQPNFKWQFYNNEKAGVAIAAGVLVSLPLTHRSIGTKSGLFYVVGSKDFTGTYGPRFTFGGYTLAGKMDAGTDRTGVLAGYEQPVTKRFSVLADWFSGNNSLGYVTPAVGYTFSENDSIYAGYSFGNHGRGNNSLGVYYGRRF